MDCSRLGLSVHGISQATILEWIPSPGHPPDPGIEPASPASPALAGGFFTTSATWEALYTCVDVFKTFHKGTVASWFYFLLPRLTVFSDLFTLILVGLAGSFRC